MVDFFFFTENTCLMKYTMASKSVIGQYLHLMLYHFTFTKKFVSQSLSSSQLTTDSSSARVKATILVL